MALPGIASPPIDSPRGGLTIELPRDFTASEAREVLSYLMHQTLRASDPARLTAFLLDDDRLAWALAGLRGHGSPDDVDEKDARSLVHRLMVGAGL